MNIEPVEVDEVEAAMTFNKFCIENNLDKELNNIAEATNECS